MTGRTLRSGFDVVGYEQHTKEYVLWLKDYRAD